MNPDECRVSDAAVLLVANLLKRSKSEKRHTPRLVFASWAPLPKPALRRRQIHGAAS